MKKRKHRVSHEKPRICDPGMCDNCQYIGEGDFICDDRPEGPVIVVEDWQLLKKLGAARDEEVRDDNKNDR